MSKVKGIIEALYATIIVYVVYEANYIGYKYLVRYGVEKGFSFINFGNTEGLNVEQVAMQYVKSHPITYTLICLTIIIVIMIIMIKLSGNTYRESLWIYKLDLASYFSSVVIGIGLVIFTYGLLHISTIVFGFQVTYLDSYYADYYKLSFIFIVVGVITPIMEEIFFRGYVVTRLSNYFSDWIVVILSAVIFAASHQNIAQSIIVMPLAIISAISVTKTKSIIAPIIIHITYNIIYVYFSLMYNIELNNTKALFFLFGGIILVAFGHRLLYTSKEYNENNN